MFRIDFFLLKISLYKSKHLLSDYEIKIYQNNQLFVSVLNNLLPISYVPIYNPPNNSNKILIYLNNVQIHLTKLFLNPDHSMIINDLKFSLFESSADINILNKSIQITNIITSFDKYIYWPKYATIVPEDRSVFIDYVGKLITSKNVRINLTKNLTKSLIFRILFNSKLLGSYMIKKFNLDMSKYVKISDHNLTLRNVFTRRLKPQYEIIITNPTNPTNPTKTNFYAVATSRLHYMKLEPTSFDNSYPNIIVKHSAFDHRKIINDKNFKPSELIVFRLAPQDYHHFYMPMDGILLDYYYMGDDYQSVSFDHMYSDNFNPLNDNFRLVMKFKHISKSGSKIGSKIGSNIFYLIIIGATIVGSIQIDDKLEINRVFYSTEHLGYFDFGGSTVVYMSDLEIELRPDIKYYSSNNIETYIEVFDKLSLDNMPETKSVNGLVNEFTRPVNEFTKLDKTSYKLNKIKQQIRYNKFNQNNSHIMILIIFIIFIIILY